MRAFHGELLIGNGHPRRQDGREGTPERRGRAIAAPETTSKSPVRQERLVGRFERPVRWYLRPVIFGTIGNQTLDLIS